MNESSHDVLPWIAGIASTLLGTFIVAAVFYIGSQTHRRLVDPAATDDYWRSGMRWIFAAYSIPMLVALALASLPPIWGAITFIALTGALIAMTFDTGWRLLRRAGPGTSRALKVNEWVTTAVVLIAAVLPWVLGGWVPAPPSFIPSLLLLLAAGLTSTATLVMAEFDAATGTTAGEAAVASDVDD